jgi:type I restriction enzyme S subunit
MTSRATVGELTINIHAATTNQGFITLIPNENLSIHFLYVWLKSKLKKVHNLASGSTFPEISKTDFRNIEVIIGTKKIHVEFDNIMKPIFKSIEKNTKEVQTLTHLRDSLLPKLMIGDLQIKA